MDGRQHVLLAAALELTVAARTGQSLGWALAGAPVAMAFSAGRYTSPDADQGWLGWLPGGHRGLTHWWGLPAAAAVAAYRADLGEAPWLIWAAIIGWASHLVGDAIFGERPGGIPVAPWWLHWGLGLNSGGRIEKLATWPGCAALVWWATGWPGAHRLNEALQSYLT